MTNDNKKIIFILVVLVIISVGGVAFYITKYNSSQKTQINDYQQINQNNSIEKVKTLFSFNFAKCVLSKSADLINWQEQKIDSPMCDEAEQRTGIVFFKDKFWGIGGSAFGGDSEDPDKNIMTSSDGITWNVVAKDVPFVHYFYKALVFNNAMWAFSYGSKSAYYSSDGVNWKVATLPVEFGTDIRVNNTIVFKDKLWLFSKSSSWLSSDGITWSKNETDSFKSGHLLEFNGKLFSYYDGTSDTMATNNVILSTSDTNEIWSSEDGIHWILFNSNPEWNGRKEYSLFSFDNRMWITGGITYGKKFSDLWSSVDGKEWVHEQQKSIPKYNEDSFGGFYPVVANYR